MRQTKSPESIDACRQLSRQGISAMELGKWYEAEALLRRAAEAAPTDADARKHLAETLWQKGELAAAIVEIDRARELEPANPYTAVRAGEMHLVVGDFEVAGECAQAAIIAAPTLSEPWLLRGKVAGRQNRSNEALADLNRALSLAPNNTDALFELAKLHQSRNEPQRCLTSIHQWLDCYPPGQEPQQALLLEGQTYLALNRPQAAAESLYLAMRRGNPSAELCCLQAEAAIATGNPNQAIAFAQQAIALDSANPAAMQLVARLSNDTVQR